MTVKQFTSAKPLPAGKTTTALSVVESGAGSQTVELPLNCEAADVGFWVSATSGDINVEVFARLDSGQLLYLDSFPTVASALSSPLTRRVDPAYGRLVFEVSWSDAATFKLKVTGLSTAGDGRRSAPDYVDAVAITADYASAAVSTEHFRRGSLVVSWTGYNGTNGALNVQVSDDGVDWHDWGGSTGALAPIAEAAGSQAFEFTNLGFAWLRFQFYIGAGTAATLSAEYMLKP